MKSTRPSRTRRAYTCASARNPITEAYADAVGSLSVLGADVYARYPGDAPSPSTIEVNPARKDIERQTTVSKRQARRWHEDQLRQRKLAPVHALRVREQIPPGRLIPAAAARTRP